VTTTSANQAPLAVSIINKLQAPEGNTAGPLALSPLAGSDVDGTVASYTITSIPDAVTQGVLRLNGTAVTTNQSIPVGDITKLTFDPVSTYVGNVFFSYTATDNSGAVSVPALYTIQVGQDINSLYTNTPAKTLEQGYQNGYVLSNVYDVNGGRYSGTAITDNGVRTASLAAGSNPMPAGTALDPATGAITVSNRLLLVPGTYTVTITTVDTNGGTNTQPVTFTIGANPLPVELKAFEATANNTNANLTWSTASEQNNDHFVVERSLNGSTFERIGQVRGQGTTSRVTSYSFTDANIGSKHQGVVYYRLQQVDTDGTASYSPVRTVSFSAGLTAGAVAVGVYPNPATSQDQAVTLALTSLPTGTYEVTVLDGMGRVVRTQTVQGGQNQPLNVQQLPAGTYLVKVQGNALNLTQRFSKQ
jgi:hypothetical protein